MKTKLTKEIEQALVKKYCSGTFKNTYGALEVPVDYTLGNGKENIDFATYNPTNQDITCFEIKVTKSDFNSQASLSFYGNKNYLVVPLDLGLYLKQNWHNQTERQTWTHSNLPLEKVGVIAYTPDINKVPSDLQLKVKDNFLVLINAKHKDVHLGTKANLLEGILRAGCRDAEKSYLKGENL